MSRKPRKGLSPQRLGARGRSAMTALTMKNLGAAGINFLMSCSDRTLGSYELARLAAASDLRSDLQEILDQLIEATAEASVVRWFRNIDRQMLKRAIEDDSAFDAVALARQQIREQGDGARIPLPALPPGAAHLAAALRYQERNLAEGKCSLCPEPLDPNSVRHCTKHLRDARLRYKPKNAKGAEPGSVGWLHGEGFESQHGRMPGTLQATNITRQKKTRAVLADMGLPFDSTATATQASKEALLTVMPRSAKEAMLVWELFDKANLEPHGSTAKHALLELVQAGTVQRIGKGIRGNPYRYFAGEHVARE